jgi:hypothetical protein
MNKILKALGSPITVIAIFSTGIAYYQNSWDKYKNEKSEQLTLFPAQKPSFRKSIIESYNYLHKEFDLI